MNKEAQKILDSLSIEDLNEYQNIRRQQEKLQAIEKEATELSNLKEFLTGVAYFKAVAHDTCIQMYHINTDVAPRLLEDKWIGLEANEHFQFSIQQEYTNADGYVSNFDSLSVSRHFNSDLPNAEKLDVVGIHPTNLEKLVVISKEEYEAAKKAYYTALTAIKSINFSNEKS